MTLLGIGAVVTIVIALAGVMDSFDNTLSASRQEALAGASDRITVDFTTPQGADSRDIQRVVDAQTVGATQTSLRVASTLVAGPSRVDVALETISDRRPLWHPTFRAGTLPSGRPGLVIARRAAENLDVTIGDQLTVVHPMATGPVPSGSPRPGCRSPASTPARCGSSPMSTSPRPPTSMSPVS